MKNADFFFPCSIEEDMQQMSKMLWIMSGGVRGFLRDARILKERNIDDTNGLIDAYDHLAPMIDTDQDMEWLTWLVGQKGAKLSTEIILGDLFDQELDLHAK